MPKPDFDSLWRNYPAKRAPCNGPWPNQCAIRMSVCLNNDATISVNATSYSEPKCAHGRAFIRSCLIALTITACSPAPSNDTPLSVENKSKNEPLPATETAHTSQKPNQEVCDLQYNGRQIQIPELGPDCSLSLDRKGNIRQETVNDSDSYILVAGTTVADKNADSEDLICNTTMAGVKVTPNKVLISEGLIEVAGCGIDELDEMVFLSWTFNE